MLLGDGYKLSYLLTDLLNKNSSNNNNTICRETVSPLSPGVL